MWRDPGTLVAIGAMRLSTEPSPNSLDRDQRGIATLHAAFDAGVMLVDTANSYALDAGDIGHNERLIARALAEWQGDRRRITVITKGGLTRPGGRWVPDGRARHLRDACEASRQALGQAQLPLYQLHAPDPKVQWTTSVRALAALQRDTLIADVGLCNVNLTQLEAARAIVPIATVQVELNPWTDRAISSGVFDYCLKHDILLLAYRPFGGVRGRRRVANDPVLKEIAHGYHVSPFAIVLAWMRTLAPHVVPLPGPTRAETARDSARGQQLTLSLTDRLALDRHLPVGRFRTPSAIAAPSPSASTGTEAVVMVMGLPGAGKSTCASRLVEEGYVRLNRDETGGSLEALVPRLDEALQRDGSARVVLDNTYLSRASRAGVLAAARRHGRSVRGVWLDTTLEDAQVNVVWRMLQAHGRLLSGDELKGGPDRITPNALFRAQRELERPTIEEGFSTIAVVPFVRDQAPGSRRAVILWLDGTIRPARQQREAGVVLEAETLAANAERLARYQAEGYLLLALSWEPQITERGVPHLQVERELAALREQVGLDIEFHYCPHGAGPPMCWCRKPLPGLGVLLIHRHQLDPTQCIYVGSSPQDPLFARRLGFTHRARI